MVSRWLFRKDPSKEEMYKFLNDNFGEFKEVLKQRSKHEWFTPYGFTILCDPSLPSMWFMRLDEDITWPPVDKEINGCINSSDVQLLIEALKQDPHRLWRPEREVIQLADALVDGKISRHHMGPKWHITAPGFSAFNNPFNLSTGYCSAGDNFEVRLGQDEPLEEQSVEDILQLLSRTRPELLKVEAFRCSFCREKMQVIKKCSRCKKVRYCGQFCQKKDWDQHKKVCVKSL